jgi:hypothetical protein
MNASLRPPPLYARRKPPARSAVVPLEEARSSSLGWEARAKAQRIVTSSSSVRVGAAVPPKSGCLRYWKACGGVCQIRCASLKKLATLIDEFQSAAGMVPANISRQVVATQDRRCMASIFCSARRRLHAVTQHTSSPNGGEVCPDPRKQAGEPVRTRLLVRDPSQHAETGPSKLMRVEERESEKRRIANLSAAVE